MRPVPSTADVIEAMQILAGPITGGQPFDVKTDERAATVVLDFGVDKLLKTPVPAAAPMAQADFHAAYTAAVASADPNKINLGGWLQLIGQILGLLGPILGGLGAPPTAPP